MHTLTLKRVLGFTIVILLLLALFIWGIGLETLKARQVDLLYLGQRHLMLVFTSMFFALLVGIPSGILLSRPAAKGFAEYVMQIFNVGNTLPPLAVLALAMVIIGIGDTPAIVALFLASLLPIVRNTYAGLCSVPASLIEAANGIGMTKWQRLRQVELPNAWPVMTVRYSHRDRHQCRHRAAGLSDWRQQLRRADFPGNLSQRFSDVDPRRNGHGVIRADS